MPTIYGLPAAEVPLSNNNPVRRGSLSFVRTRFSVLQSRAVCSEQPRRKSSPPREKRDPDLDVVQRKRVASTSPGWVLAL